MVQIKVTPERLEQSAKLVLETKNRLEQIHKDLYNQTEYVASMWNGATSQRFYQMFEVERVLSLVKKRGGTQEDAVEALHDIRERLLDGELKLNKPKKE